MYLTSPIPPSVNHYLGYRVVKFNGKMTAASYETAEAKKYKKDFTQYVLDEVKAQEWELIPNKTQHFYVDCHFYFGRTDMDPNNYFKLPLDAITDSQAIWLDDNVTLERVQKLCYDTENPRIEMYIHPVDYIGIFDDPEWVAQFEERCQECFRWNNGRCTVYKDSLNGRIHGDVYREKVEDPQQNPYVCGMYRKKKKLSNK